MGVPSSFLSLLKDPAPGLVFQANTDAGVGRRAFSTPHIPARGAGWGARRTLKSLLRSGGVAMDAVHDLYAEHDGLSLCVRRDPVSMESRAALSFLPIAAWEGATQTAMDADDGRLFADLDYIYPYEAFRVIASSPVESTLLTILLEDGEDPRARAGSIYYLSLRPVCDRTVPIALDMNVLLEQIAANPAGFFHTLGFTGHVQSPDGKMHPDLIEAYVGDVRQHPDLVRV